MHLLQICNVGNLCGGTAACAWTITRACPDWRHTVLFLSPVTAETAAGFRHCRVERVGHLDRDLLERHAADAVILHNLSPDRWPRIDSVVTIQYRHSAGPRAPGDAQVACSRWLAEVCREDIPVLYQAVPVPPRLDSPARETRHLDERLVIGRICTPTPRKWPAELIPFYAELNRRFPRIRWEFVGAPPAIQADLARACGGRARFLPANWKARGHLWRWHALLYHHPTLTESFGRTVAEAMRAGCVPIVDRRGGFTEQVDEGGTGFLATGIDEFHRAVESLGDPALRWELSRRARQSADDRFSLQRFAIDLRRLLWETA